jgi:hypothetical protein
VAALVLLNVGQLIIFFLHAAESGDNELPNTMRQSPGKQWPQLRSFTLWTAKPDLDLRSCEALFGNGFTQPFTCWNRSRGRGCGVPNTGDLPGVGVRLGSFSPGWWERGRNWF